MSRNVDGSMKLEDALEQARAGLAERFAPVAERAAAVAAALDAYVAAHEARLAAEFAEGNGLPRVAPVADIAEAASLLSSLVAALPELAGANESAGAATNLPTSATPGTEQERANASPKRFETMELLTIEEAARSLAKDFDSAELGGMRLDEFMLHAEEFAARARALQERSGGDPLSQRVIRRLTALAHEREVPRRVFGLSRAHQGDWERLAQEARGRRLEALAARGNRLA